MPQRSGLCLAKNATRKVLRQKNANEVWCLDFGAKTHFQSNANGNRSDENLKVAQWSSHPPQERDRGFDPPSPIMYCITLQNVFVRAKISIIIQCDEYQGILKLNYTLSLSNNMYIYIYGFL
jgi:hypothetical protein